MSTAAIRSLESRVISPEQAVSNLASLTEAAQMIGLFAKYFPAEFAGQRLRWLDSESLTRACSMFMCLVDQGLFPCCDTTNKWDFEESDLRDIFAEAPFLEWYDEARDGEFNLLEADILLTAGHLKRHGPRYEVVLDFGAARRLDPDRLASDCAATRAPLKYLPLAVNFVLKGTGNIWCDVSQEELDYGAEWPEWNEENIEWLAREWKEAQEIQAKVDGLNAWMLARPRHREQVIELLTRATKAQPQQIRIGAPLVEQVDQWQRMPDEQADEWLNELEDDE